MAKLLKQVLVSTEYVVLGNAQPIEADHKPLAPSSNQPLLDECQLQAMREEAYQQGYLLAKEEAKTALEQQLLSLKQQLEESLLAIPKAVAHHRLLLKQEIADIVLLITQQFFIAKHRDHQGLELQINQILQQLNDQQTVELWIHPQEIALLQQGKIKLDATHLNGLKIKSDESLSLGGYRLKTEHGIFDASLEKQIDKLKELLLKIRQSEPYVSLD